MKVLLLSTRESSTLHIEALFLVVEQRVNASYGKSVSLKTLPHAANAFELFTYTTSLVFRTEA